MTSSAQPAVNSRSLERVDFSDREHRALIFDVAMANRRHLLNDHDSDIVVIINTYQRWAAMGAVHAFLALVNDAPVGCFWVEIDTYGVGRVRGGLLPGFRNPFTAMYFLRSLIEYAFDKLKIRKLEFQMPLYNKKDRQSAATERIMKRIGFQKRAIIPEAVMIDGQAKDTILLDYLRKDYLNVTR